MPNKYYINKQIKEKCKVLTEIPGLKRTGEEFAAEEYILSLFANNTRMSLKNYYYLNIFIFIFILRKRIRIG